MKRALVAFFILAALGLASCGPTTGMLSAPAEESTLAPVPADFSGKQNPLGPDAASAGAQTFETNCAACHGEGGHGDGPAGTSLDPAPRNLAELSPMAADDYLFWRISTGRPGTAMPAWKGVLTDEQIWELVSFIRSLK